MSEPDTFMSHLIELRDRLLRCIVALLVVFIALFPWASEIYALVAKPMLAALPNSGQMIATGVVTTFFVPVKVTMLAALLIALPFVLYQIWAFVAPGLYQHEKRLVAPLVISSTILFFCGMAFAYFVVFPIVFTFLAKFAPAGVSYMPDIQAYLDFVLTTFVAFGITFEVPIAVVVLVRAGVVSVSKLREIRPYVIVGAFVIAAIFTPPDVISQLLLAVPLCALYEMGIVVATWVARPQRAAQSDSA
ncbi:MAG TPA: twin-arginine translocase subunit TatC [Burkholderiales bacterium]|jgi:sec-independent protein translocase protein TatC|nr:twin-arginine translocase subunit TatC [Burkholderiales bacterium]